MTWKDFYEGLRGKKEFALFAWDDPMPFIRSAWSHLKNAWKQNERNENVVRGKSIIPSF